MAKESFSYKGLEIMLTIVAIGCIFAPAWGVELFASRGGSISGLQMIFGDKSEGLRFSIFAIIPYVCIIGGLVARIRQSDLGIVLFLVGGLMLFYSNCFIHTSSGYGIGLLPGWGIIISSISSILCSILSILDRIDET